MDAKQLHASCARERLAGFRDWSCVAVFLYGTIAAIVAAFLVFHRQSLVVPVVDVDGFGFLSRNLALGKGLSLGFGPTIRRAPLYPFFGGTVLKLFGHDTLGVPDLVAYRPIIAAQCLLFGLTCVTTWGVARRLFGPRVALTAALLCPIFPQSLRYIGETEVEIAMGLFIVLLAYTGLRLVDRPSLATGAAFGLTAAAATLTKPITELYPFVFLALAWWYWRGTRRGELALRSVPNARGPLIASCAVLIFFAIPLLPWMARNAVVTNGQFIGISSHGPGEALRGYLNVQPKYFLLRDDLNRVGDPEANANEELLLGEHGLSFYQWNNFYGGSVVNVPPIPSGVISAPLEARTDQIEGAEVLRRLVHQPGGFVHKLLIQLATFWYVVDGRAKSLLVGVIAAAALFFAALGVFRAGRENVATWPVVAILVYVNLVYAATLASGRYSMPLFPTLLVLSANGLASLVPRFSLSPSPVRHPNRRAFEMEAHHD